MKNLIKTSLVALLVIAFTNTSNAQFLKNLQKKVEQKAQEKVNQEIDKKVDKALDEVFDEENYKNQESDNRSNQSMESPIDISKYVKANANGKGLHFKYSMTVDMKEPQMENFTVKSSQEMFSNMEGKSRVEFIMDAPFIGLQTTSMVTNEKVPNQVIMLNHKNKKYSIVESKEEKKPKKEDSFIIEKVGTETINGRKCIHGRAINEKTKEIFVFWTSRDIDGYQKMVDLYAKNKQTGSNNMWAQMRAADCDGYIVKMIVPMGKQGSSIMELEVLEKVDINPAFFEVPSDYKETKGGWASSFVQ